MKKIFAFITLLVVASWQLSFVSGQGCYWVLLTDKAGTTFDPYSYFDSKAIERYRLNNADLYDISNYPLNESYVEQVRAIVEKDNSDDVHFAVNSPQMIGQSRWFNAVAVMATEEQIAAIEKLPFVLRTDLIASGMEVTEYMNNRQTDGKISDGHQSGIGNTKAEITDQLVRMQGNLFVDKGIDGSGVRIAVFDGGFHAVNTHAAFKHLRDNNQIVATWDFTKNQETVFDNHTHGTMVLSCIAGRLGNRQLGLATGATFLLAKTEVEPEPFKEEVWWAQAAEWADKNGADIINSSLGYTKDRHYTWEMDGRSYVSKAANMAASKGILVCNSAGNSGSDDNWKIIGAPADADSILSVGGIVASLTSYQHISFSSYGPTADGRMKPNVCAFGYAEVADPHNDTATTFAYGTSFSSPLTAGFCACAWQTMRGNMKNAQQMKRMVEESGDLYPYYDYAFGFGVPQASYFLDEAKRIVEHVATFWFEEREKYVIIRPIRLRQRQLSKLDLLTSEVKEGNMENVVMFKIQDRKGLVDRYVNLGSNTFDESTRIAIPKGALTGYELVAHVNGFTNRYRLSKLDSAYFAGKQEKFEYYVIDSMGVVKSDYKQYGNRSLEANRVSNWGVGQKYLSESYLQYGMQWTFGHGAPLRYSDEFNTGFRYMRNFKKWYSLGAAFEVGWCTFRYEQGEPNVWDNRLALTDFTNVEKKRLSFLNTKLELFQRIRIVQGRSLNSKGLHWDLGLYGSSQISYYRVEYGAEEIGGQGTSRTDSYRRLKALDKYTWGISSRLVWNWIGIYGRLRMSQTDIELPRLTLGLQISY